MTLRLITEYSFQERLDVFFEKISVTPLQWIAGFTAVTIVRFFIESLSSPQISGIPAFIASSVMHSSLFYLAVALTLVLVFTYILPEKRHLIIRLVIFFLPIIFLAPLFDLVLSSTHNSVMTYIYQPLPQLWYSFLTFFGPLGNGITLGMRIEIAFILLTSAWYIYASRTHVLRALWGTFLIYVVLFLFLAVPSLIIILAGKGLGPTIPSEFYSDVMTRSATLATNLHGDLRYGSADIFFQINFDYIIGRILFLISVITALIWFYNSYRNRFVVVLSNIRIERLIHYLVMAGVGIFLALNISPPYSYSWNDIFTALCFAVSITAAWIYSVCTNDIQDVHIDTISNTDRPIIQQMLSIQAMQEIARVSLIVAIVGAFLSGYYALFSIMAFISIYYVYSIPPTHLRRIPFISSALIALACLSIVYGAFFTISGLKYISLFPHKAVFGILLIAFLWSHIKDIKDIAGDEQAGIRTIPNMLGPVWGPRIAGICAALTFILAPILANQSRAIPLFIIPALLTYYFAARKPYNEKSVFIVYLVTVAVWGLVLVLQ